VIGVLFGEDQPTPFIDAVGLVLWPLMAATGGIGLLILSLLLPMLMAGPVAIYHELLGPVRPLVPAPAPPASENIKPEEELP
jgi:hypothetical protein